MNSLATAQQIAARALQERIARSPVFSRFAYGEAQLAEENDRFRVFTSFSETAFQAGVMPPSLHVCVDKTDGRVLTEAEQERYYVSAAPAVVRAA